MAGIVRLMAVAVRGAAATTSCRNRTRPEIAQRGDLCQHFGTTLLQSRKGIRHGKQASFTRAYHIRSGRGGKKKRNAAASTFMSHTPGSTCYPRVRGIRIHLPMRLTAEAPPTADTVSASETPARRARWAPRSSPPSAGFKESIMEQKLKIAVFIDFDNIEIGVKSTLHREFDVAAVLDALKERGEIVTDRNQ